MILGANHIAISVPDLGKALEFYRDLLGFEQVGEFGWEENSEMSVGADIILAVKGTAAHVVHLKCQNLLIEIFEFKAGNPEPQNPNRPVIDHGLTHLCFAVKDLDMEYKRLKAAGMKFHSPPVPVADNVRTVYGRDPFGNVVELEEMEGREKPSQHPYPVSDV
jgi:catechol 2,3-dioxygenase-like lactoylglutathione lyase family enzyme